MIYIGDDKIQIRKMHHLIETNIAARTGPKDVIEYMVRVSCDRLDEWRFGMFSLKCQNETAKITLQNTIATTRRVKTIARNLVGFRSIAMQFKVAEQQNDAHSVRTLKRVVEHPLVIKGLICSVRTSRTRS